MLPEEGTAIDKLKQTRWDAVMEVQVQEAALHVAEEESVTLWQAMEQRIWCRHGSIIFQGSTIGSGRGSLATASAIHKKAQDLGLDYPGSQQFSYFQYPKELKQK